MSDLDWIGLLVGFLLFGPLVAWGAGVTNPIGWLGVPPWRVPKCNRDCPDGDDFGHATDCARNPLAQIR